MKSSNKSDHKYSGISQKIKWHPFFSRGQHPVLVNYLFWRAFRHLPELFGLPPVKSYRRDTHIACFDKNEYKSLVNTVQYKLQYDLPAVERSLKLANKKFIAINKKVAKLSRIDWNKQSTPKVKQACLELFDLLTYMFTYVYWPFWADEAAHKIVEQPFKKQFGADWQWKYWEATRPRQLTTQQQFRLTLLKLAAKVERHKINKSELQIKSCNLSKKFGYLRTYIFRVNPYQTADIKKEISHILFTDAKTQLKKWNDDRRRELANGLAIRRKQSPKFQRLLKVIGQIVYLREERISWWGKLITQAYDLLKVTAQRFNLSYDNFLQLTYDEFLTGQVDISKINQRLNGFNFIAIDNKADIILGQPPSADHKRIECLKGIIANPGKITGRIQFADAYTFSKVRPGVILLTAMTTPNATPYLRRVKAIITDEGGATAHAATMARELNIPCLVGTKVATKVFKTGDLVEVDANKGIIKLIKSQRP